MRKITLFRKYLEDKTVGRFHIGLYRFNTLELPDKNNQVNISCIPEGEYLVKRNKTGRWQYFEVCDVAGRTHIEIHPATLTSQLLGCIGLENTEYCELLLTLIGDNSFTLVIKEMPK